MYLKIHNTVLDVLFAYDSALGDKISIFALLRGPIIYFTIFPTHDIMVTQGYS